MIDDRDYDVVIVGSGAGGGTVAQELGPLVRGGASVLVVEQGPRLRDDDFSGRELEMASALYEDGGGFLTSDGTMTLAFGRAYGGSTVVYTGTSLIAPERVIRRWHVPDLAHDDIERRSRKYMAQNSVHELTPDLINDNNRLFVEGCRKCGWTARQFPLNLKGCLGSGLCNLGCPNLAKQGTHRVHGIGHDRVVDDGPSSGVHGHAILRCGTVAREHENHLQPRKGAHELAVTRAEARHALRGDEREVHARLQYEALLLRAVEVEALRMPDIVRDPMRMFRDEDLCRMAGEVRADVRNRPRDGRPENECRRPDRATGEDDHPRTDAVRAGVPLRRRALLALPLR